MKYETPKEWSSHTVWTNIFFALAGIFGFIYTGFAGIIPIAALIFLAYGSWAYHFHLDDRGMKLDWGAMYAVSAAFSYYLVAGDPWWVISVLTAAFLTYILVKNRDRDFKYLAFMNIPLAVFVFAYMPLWLALLITAVFAVAVYLRVVVEKKYTGKKRKFIHGVWHLLTSIGFGLMFL